MAGKGKNMSLEAFSPAATVAIAAGVVSVDTVLPATGGAILITNAAAQFAFVRMGVAGVVATLTDTPVAAGSKLLLRVPPSVTDIAVILNGGTGTVFATIGHGASY